MVFGISLVKDECDVIAHTLRHMAGQVDRLLVADNASTDGTRDILADLARDLPLTVIDDLEVAHYQARKLTALAAKAGDMGARFVVPFDADELVMASAGRVADVIKSTRRVWIFTIVLYDHVPTGLDPDGHPFERMGWRKRDPGPFPKIACRPNRNLVIEEGAHSCHYAGNYPTTVDDALTTRHFPYRSLEQFVSKARNGARGRGATDLPEWVSNHLREYGRILDAEGEPGLERVWRDRFFIEDPTDNPALIFDPVGL